MNHEERMKLSEEISKRVVEKYKEKILVAGIFGSTSRNQDTELSDLEMIFITTEDIEDIFFSYKGMPVLLVFRTKEEALGSIKKMSFMWPMEVSFLLDFLPTYGDKKVINEFKKELSSLKDKDYKKGARNSLIHAYEYFLKIKSSYEKKDKYTLIDATVWCTYFLNMTIAFINKKYFTRSEPQNLDEIKDFGKIPEQYLELADAIWNFNTMDEIYDNIMRLWDVSIGFAKENGIEIEDKEVEDAIK